MANGSEGQGNTDTVSNAPGRWMTTPDGGVMEHYMATMRGFLRAEQRVMEAVLVAAPRNPQPIPVNHTARHESGPDNAYGPLPLLGEVVSLVPGESLVAWRRFAPAEDRYLHDHTFGGQISFTDPALQPLMVAPLTISLELMAEAAAQLAPSLTLVGLSDIRAYRWVQVDENAPTVLDVRAHRLPGDDVRVRVEVRDGADTDDEGAMVIEATVIFGQAYPHAPEPHPFTPANPRRTARSAQQMYAEKWMFHGPVFQGVRSLDVSGDDGITGVLEVLPTTALFHSTARPRLLTDLALLDAAGQLLGYWAKERLPSNFLVFPIRVAAIHIYSPNLPVGTRARCDVRITEIVPQMVKVDMDIYEPSGRLWMQVKGWQDWRFHLSEPANNYWRFPASTVMSVPYRPPVPPGLSGGELTCYRIEMPAESSQGIVAKSLAYMTLNHAERRAYHQLDGGAQRQAEWLQGRIAAKDAVRMYLRQRFGLPVGPGDVEITADAAGRPVARGVWEQQVAAPAISLSHADGCAIAIAVDAAAIPQVGIDIQQIELRDPDFDAIAFDAHERALLDGLAPDARNDRRTRLWCAKEAVAKALGLGLVDGPQTVVVESWNGATATALVALRGTLAARFPHLVGRQLVAYTARDGNYIVATSFGEKVEAVHRQP